MAFSDWFQIVFFTALIIVLPYYLANFLLNIFSKRDLPCRWVENLCYKIAGIDPNIEMDWKSYLKTLLLFNFFGFVFIFALQIFQNLLPFNPQNFPGVSLPLAFNTAMSFVTNTDWQAYAGETTLSYFTQMVGLTVQNFLSAATGICALLVLIRGIIRKETDFLGNFWVDLVRSVVYLLLPLSIITAVFLANEGVIQNLSPYVEVTTLENGKQIIPMGPVASQIAIKQIGTNGGGFFNVNSAHPFENPTGFSNLIELFAIMLIPAALVHMYGIMVDSKKHSWMLYLLMFIVWSLGIAISFYSEHLHNPILEASPLLEGKETRFGITNSLLWSVSTTCTANGSVNSMISSLSPLAGGIAMFNIMMGGSIFGGIGVGLISMIMYVLIAMFLCGLMVGRTPEYLGKKIEIKEIKWVVLSILVPSALIMIGAGISCIMPVAVSSIENHGPHGLSEILYAFSSCALNNGSAFAGLNANTTYYNIVLGIVMFIGRLAIIVPAFTIGGLLARKRITPQSVGSFSTNTFMFLFMLGAAIIILGALAFFPALLLGPIVEHLLMLKGRSF